MTTGRINQIDILNWTLYKHRAIVWYQLNKAEAQCSGRSILYLTIYIASAHVFWTLENDTIQLNTLERPPLVSYEGLTHHALVLVGYVECRKDYNKYDQRFTHVPTYTLDRCFNYACTISDP